jgi:hypothetical protein
MSLGMNGEKFTDVVPLKKPKKNFMDAKTNQKLSVAPRP